MTIHNSTAMTKLSRAQHLAIKVDQLLAVVSAAAAGDLTTIVPDCGEETIGQMGASLAEFLTDLRERIGIISRNATTVARSPTCSTW